MGRKTRVPWVRIFDPSLSPRATEGLYAVFLFERHGSAVYLSLNQGTTEFRDGALVPRNAGDVARNPARARIALQGLVEGEPRLSREMDLGDPKGLGDGYQVGNIASYRYPADSLPDDEQLSRDVSFMLGLLDRLYKEDLSNEPEESSETPAVPALRADTYTDEDAARDLFIPFEHVSEILRLLNRKLNVVLQGPPGVGKTYAAKRLAHALIGERSNERLGWVQFHQSYSYEDFLEGYRPDGSGGFALAEGLFYRFCKRASQDTGRAYVFVIDEINRGNLSRIFGEALSLLEADKRDELVVTLPYSGRPFSIPRNVFLIGLMNTADRSLAVVDYALRRRFVFVDLKPQFDSPKFAHRLTEMGVPAATVEQVRERFADVNGRIGGDAKNLGRGFEIGHSFFCPTSSVIDAAQWYEETVRYEILPLLREYWFDSPRELAAAQATLLPQ